LYTVSGYEPVGTTAAPTITIDGETLADLKTDNPGVDYTITSVSGNQQIITIMGLENYSTDFSLEAAGGIFVYMNSSLGNSYPVDISSGTVVVRVINQSGDAEPFITLIQLSV
jgi:hypothetical protein